jgi:hypothetical protein
MNLLSGIIKGDSSFETKQLAYLINIIKQLGWESFTDKRTIKPNLRRTQIYLRKHSKNLKELFKVSFDKIGKKDIVDTLNPFLIEMWHVQIIGTIDEASLELLHITKGVDK